MKEPIGEFEENYLVYSNDSKNPSITLTVAGNVKPLPAFIKRMGNVDLRRGETVGSFNIWPTARPLVTVDRGERFSFSLRVKLPEGKETEIKLATTELEPVACKLRRGSGSQSWLDFDVGPISQPGSISKSVSLETEGSEKATIWLTVIVVAENLTTTPNSIDIPNLSLAGLEVRDRTIGRIGIRKSVGTFRIKTLTSTLPFVKLEQRILVEGSNYLIRLTIDSTKLPKAGPYSGSVRIETDDPVRPLLEIPIKIRLVER